MNNEENGQEGGQGEQQNSIEKKVADAGKDAVRQKARAIGQQAKQAAKKAAKKVAAKVAAKLAAVVAANIVPITIGLVIVILISFVASSFYAIQDKITDLATSIGEGVVNVLKIGDNGPLLPNAEEILKSIDTELNNMGIKKEDLYLGNENQANAYLYKFMIASLSTQIPYVQDSLAENIKDSLKDIALHGMGLDILNLFLEEEEVNGIVKIKRCNSNDNKSKQLKYIKYGKADENNTFLNLVANNDASALDYFSIDENWMLCVAKYQKITVTGERSENTYTLQEVKIPYKTMIQNYAIPFSFFLTLQQMTQNAEYVSAVADMIMEQGEIEVTLYDTVETVTSEYTYKYDVMKKWIVEIPVVMGGDSNTSEENTGNSGTTVNKPNSGRPAPEGSKPTITDRAVVKRTGLINSNKKIAIEDFIVPGVNDIPGNETDEGSATAEGGLLITEILNNQKNETDEEKPSNPVMTIQKRELVEEGKEEKTKTVTETNTITANVTKANVWVISHTAEYEKDDLPTEYPLGKEGITAECDPKDEPEPEGEEGSWKINRTEHTFEKNDKKGWKLKNTDTQIQPDIFLGMWKNAYGKYVKGAEFEPKGKLVKYPLPGSVKKQVSESAGEEIVEGKVHDTPITVLLSAEDMFLDLLERREETQVHAQVMRELLNYYKAGIKGKNYTIDLDLSIFDVSEFTGVALYGSSTAKDFIHYFEGKPKETADGTQYVVFDDGAGNLTIGWGIYINAHKGRFAARGINASTLKVGSTVDKSIVDSIEDEIIEEYRNYVIQLVRRTFT